MKRKEVKSQGEKERYKHLNAEFQRIARRDKKAFLSDQCKEVEEYERQKISSRKLEIPREHFMQRWAQSKTETEAEGVKKMWQEYTEELYKKILMTQINMMVFII